MVKIATKGHSTIKMYGGNQGQSNHTNSTENGQSSSNDSLKNDNTPNTPTKSNNVMMSIEQEKQSGQISPINNITSTISKGINLFADSTVATCFFR